jgi:2-polyprenyl-3-methyl-5-hydroxy-6-metoxy-1,4-benzoquinol methylase
MPSFKSRSDKKELLDRDDLQFKDIRINMQELDFINTHLGGHRITMKGVKSFLPYFPKDEVLRITEIGSGGGDNLRVIRDWATKQQLQVQLCGIDISPECVQYAKSLQRNHGIDFIHSDYSRVMFEKKPHIIFSSLFAHHFTNDALVFMMRWMRVNSLFGFFINDLHRHPAAYYSIKWLSAAFSKSYLVKNDAPLSVLRGFTQKEWQNIFKQAGIVKFQCNWQWAFRWLLIYQDVNKDQP